MAEQKEEKKKEKKKKIEIEIGKKYKMKLEVPKSMESWNSSADMSEEYKEMLGELSSIANYITYRLNEGPETKESIVKRVLTLRAIILELLDNTFLDGFHRYGLLTDILCDIWMDTSGKSKVNLLIFKKQLQDKMKEAIRKKMAGEYVS